MVTARARSSKDPQYGPQKRDVAFLVRPREIIQDLIRIVRADALARKITVVTEIEENMAG